MSLTQNKGGGYGVGLDELELDSNNHQDIVRVITNYKSHIFMKVHTQNI